jgi:GNAT superfamily N-acetyltransferase
MFEAMGYTEGLALEAMLVHSTPLFRRGLEDGTYLGWLVESSEGKVVAGGGIILLEFPCQPRDPRPKRPVIVNMFTEPEHRRHGLARQLMQTMIGWCKSEGIRALYLHASKDGLSLYESLGFEATNEMRLSL